jgi:hypothetical protein
MSAQCSISKTPIDYGDKCIVLPLLKNRFFLGEDDDDYHPYTKKWVLAALPFEWEYDDDGFGDIQNYGRLSKRFKLSYALIHKKVWKNSHLYWHPKNNQNDFKLNLSKYNERFELETRISSAIDPIKSPKDISIRALDDVLRNQSGSTCIDITISDMLFDLPRITNRADTEKFGSLYDESLLFHQIRRLVVQGKYTEKHDKTLTRMAHFYSNKRHDIQPSRTLFEYRYPDEKLKSFIRKQKKFEASLLK